MQFLTDHHFHKVKLHFIPSNHYKVIAKINGVKGNFILDTGASTTFVSKDLKEKFKQALISTVKAISEDLKSDTKLDQKNISSKNYNFFPP